MEHIRTFIAELLDDATSQARVDGICAELFGLLKALSPVTRGAIDSIASSTPLASGVALAPSLAASCLLDAARTRAFLRGVRDALASCALRGGTEVVYAGTGPFAPLVLLLAPWIPPLMRFTLLDIHEESTRSVLALSELLGATSLVREVVTDDATKYTHARPVDLLISETMQRSLAEEPFVEIIRNFRPQLAPGAMVVPERVTLSVVTVEATREQERWNGSTVTGDLRECGRVFEVTAAGEWPDGERAVALTIDGSDDSDRWLAVVTDIVVHGSTHVRRYGSGLSIPEILWDHSPLRGAGELVFRYATGARPGLVVERA